jgi:hypothetical protein
MSKPEQVSWTLIVVLSVVTIVMSWMIATQANENYLQSDPMLKILRDEMIKVDPRAASISYNKGKKSYTINKEKMFLCLRDEKGAYYDKNMLIYVTLHELAHAFNPSIGHTQLFHETFQKLLAHAAEIGVYNNKVAPIADYCLYAKDEAI